MAEGIVKIALDAAKENRAAKISEVGLIIGEMSGVETESLRFSFDIIAQNTIASGAKLVIRRPPLAGKCAACGETIRLERYDFRCPRCKDGVLNIISGREMQVEYVDAE